MTQCEICRREKAKYLVEVEYVTTSAYYCSNNHSVIDSYTNYNENFKTCGRCCEVLEEFNNVSDSFRCFKITKLEG